MSDDQHLNGAPGAPGAPGTPVSAADVPGAASAQFAALCRAAAAGALLLVPLVRPSGAIVYSIGAVAADDGGYQPLAFILPPGKVDAMRQATREDLEAAGHLPPAPGPSILLPGSPARGH